MDGVLFFLRQIKMQVDQEEQKSPGDVNGDKKLEADEMDATGQNQVRPPTITGLNV